MRFLITLAAAAYLTAAAHAHFVFVYLAGGEARVVFGHTAAPDPELFPTRAEKTTLTGRTADGKETTLAVEKGDGNYLRAKLGTPVVVFGVTDVGVVQRGTTPSVRAWYYPKVVAGDPFAKTAVAGKAVPLEIVPVRDGEKVRFRVLADGKPAEGLDVTVAPPGQAEDHSETVKTDADGLTSGFAHAGRYCVAARRTEKKPGEVDGKKYDEVRQTATLVCDFTNPKK